MDTSTELQNCKFKDKKASDPPKLPGSQSGHMGPFRHLQELFTGSPDLFEVRFGNNNVEHLYYVLDFSSIFFL